MTQGSDDRAAKKRRNSAARSQRYRDRKKDHRRVVPLEVKQHQIADVLVAVGVMGEWDCEDPDRLRAALKEAMNKLRVTRDA